MPMLNRLTVVKLLMTDYLEAIGDLVLITEEFSDHTVVCIDELGTVQHIQSDLNNFLSLHVFLFDKESNVQSVSRPSNLD